MTQAPVPVRRAAPPARSRSGTPALLLLASLTVSALASSAAPTPLYATYQVSWGFSPITTTIVFGVYAVSVLASLLTLGKLSDHVGRRPVLLCALAVQAITMVLFATADGVPQLLLARVVQGVAAGASVGASGAAMLDIDPKRGTLYNALVPGMGAASGAILSALAVRYLPAPTHLIYLVLMGVFVLQFLGVVFVPETVDREPGALASLRPEIALPRAVRPALFVAAPVLFASWALAGLYSALGPAIVSTLVGSRSVVLGGLSLSVFAGVAVVAVYLLRGVRPHTVMVSGIGSIVVGVALALIALGVRSTGLFFVATAISGISFGTGFQGAARTVLPLARPHERAGLLSLLFVVSYLGLGLPVVVAGFLTVHGAGLLGAARDYGLASIVLAGIALVALSRGRRPATE